MVALIQMIIKNFRLLIRSKTSALIILLGPLFIIFLIGAAFNSTGLHNVKIAVYSTDYNDLTNSLLDDLRDNEFIVDKVNSEQDCSTRVESSAAHLCIVFPADMTDESMEREITFHVDYSRINLVFTILNVINKEVEDISSELSLEYTSLLIEAMNKTSFQIKEKSSLLDTLVDNANVMRNTMIDVESDLSSIVVDPDAFGMTDMDSYVSSSQQQLDDFSSLATDAIGGGVDLLNTLASYVDDFDEMLSGQIATLESYETEIATYSGMVCAIDLSAYSDYLGGADPCDKINEISDALSVAVSDAESAQSSFDEISSQLDGVRESLEGSEADQASMIASAGEGLDSLSTSLNSSTAMVSDLQTQKEGIDSQISGLLDTLEENIDTLDEVKNSINDISAELESVEVTQAEKIVNPILTRIKPILEQKSYLDYTFPALLVLIVMSMSILLSATVIMTEKNSKAYFRNYITPVRDFVFLFSTYLTNVLIILMQSMILIVIANFVFGIDLFSNLHNLLLATLVLSSVFILLGMIIGYLFVSGETATLAAISLTSVFLLFSSFLIPLESLSKTIGMVAKFNPFVLGESVLRQVVIFQKDILAGGFELIVLIVYIVVLVILLLFAEGIDKRRIKGG